METENQGRRKEKEEKEKSSRRLLWRGVEGERKVGDDEKEGGKVLGKENKGRKETKIKGRKETMGSRGG